MTNHASRLIILLACLLPTATILPGDVMAQGAVNFYSTTAASGTENYAIVLNAGNGAVPEPARLLSACNYNPVSPEVVMVFDAMVLPANGAVPKMQLPLPAATGLNAPSCGSFSLPSGGVTFYLGLAIAASTSGKTLTTDTTSGGNTFFEVGR
jgi:hypothetical protein